MLSLLFACFNQVRAQKTAFELDPEHNTTATYDEVLRFYDLLDKQYTEAKLLTYGNTDIGKPLQFMVLSKGGNFDPISIWENSIVLFNNGIHPGEPEGIDAPMMLVLGCCIVLFMYVYSWICDFICKPRLL